ncbi:MAG: YidC/Oxa1 family membrane protein insertase [Lachnospiraceae bacterium]
MQGILLTQNSGFLSPIAWVLGKIMNAIFVVLDLIGIPNIGLTIILFTIAIYILMLPMTIRQQKFSKLSAKMNPELQVVQKKYKDKKDTASQMKMREETQAVYDKYGVSPSGSCVQLLIQMPILFSLYSVIYAVPAYVARVKEAYFPLVEKLVETEGVDDLLQGFSNSTRYLSQFTDAEYLAGSTEYIQNTYIDCLNMASTGEWNSLIDAFPNLSTDIQNAYDTIYQYNSFLGLNIGNSPSYLFSQGMETGAILMCVAALMIPFLAALTQWLNVKLMPQAASQQNSESEMANSMASSMKTMNTIMPLMSAFFCFSFPTGIGIYWIGGAVVRCVQQILINKHIDKMDFDALIDGNRDKAADKAKKRANRNAKYMDQQAKMDEIAAINTKKINPELAGNKAKKMTTEERAAKMKDVDKYVKKSESSLAAKANSVKNYNENDMK